MKPALREYKRFLIQQVQEALREELTAILAYLRWATRVYNSNVAKELIEHAQEEYNHLSQLIDFAASHGFEKQLRIRFDATDVNDLELDGDDNIVARVQQLEMDAIRRYKTMAIVARSVGDLESEKLFVDLMAQEQEHFDDLANFLDQYRELVTDEAGKRK